jgi:effector-binding domain-containing protein
MPYDVEVKELPEQRVASIRRVVRTDQMEAAFAEMLPTVWRRLQEAGVEPSGPPFGLYHSFDPEGDTDLEAGVPIDADLEATEEVGVRTLPASRCAVTFHHGRYDGIGGAHGALDQWLHENGHDHGSGPVWEVYWSDPYSEQDPANLKTEVGYPF